MANQEAKRILSTIQSLKGKRPESERSYYFTCSFDPTVHIEEEFRLARTNCHTHEVECSHDSDYAMIFGKGALADQDKIDVECVRSYLLDHGWKEQPEGYRVEEMVSED